MASVNNLLKLQRRLVKQFRGYIEEDFSNWKHKKTRDGISVYVRKDNNHRTPITKTITVINATIEQIIECLRNH